MTSEQGLWALAASIATGLFVWLAARAKARADEKSSRANLEASVSDSTWERAQEWLNRLEGEVKDLREENRRISAKHELLWDENRRLREENQDQQNLIEELASWILSWQRWRSEGSEPPPPNIPFRIEKHLARIKNQT